MSGFEGHLIRCGRFGVDDLLVRTPELRNLRDKRIAIFGVGCLGATSALEFARAGIGQLRILDADIVDPATISRWPLGLSASGLLKVEALSDFIQHNYPATEVIAHGHLIGAIRHEGEKSDCEVIEQMIGDVSLIYDATAEIGIQHYLSTIARELKIPYITVVGTPGGWGGKVVCITPKITNGCWFCYRFALSDGSIIEPPSLEEGVVQGAGCGDVTFTGAGFDMAEIALNGVRSAVGLVCGNGGYPAPNWDVLTIAFRDNAGNIQPPQYSAYRLNVHAMCKLCAVL